MSLTNYRSAIRSTVRGYWSGVIDRPQFINAMDSAIHRNITNAWRTGAAECSIKPDEYTAEEKATLARFIFQQQTYVIGFADAIKENTKAEGGKIKPLFNRAELWINRWNEANNQANAMACGDRKKIWILGSTEKHCKSCAGFAGRVYRNSVWLKNGALPQSQSLSCNGYKCQCRREDTDKPITRGRFPRSLLRKV